MIADVSINRVDDDCGLVQILPDTRLDIQNKIRLSTWFLQWSWLVVFLRPTMCSRLADSETAGLDPPRTPLMAFRVLCCEMSLLHGGVLQGDQTKST